MSPKTAIRFAQILIPLGVVIGIAAALIGNGYTLVAMVLLIIGQTANAVAARRKLRPGQD